MVKYTICQVLPALRSGGVERGTVDIARAIVGAGYGSLVVSAGGGLVSQLEDEGTIHLTLPLASKNPFQMVRNIDRLKHIALDHGVNLIHARSRAPAWSVFYVVKSLGIPFVTTYHGRYNAKGPCKRAYNRIMARGDRIIAPSSFIQQHVLETYGEDLAHRITVIHRGVDLPAFTRTSERERAARALRQAWQIPAHGLLAMLPGRLTRWKGQIEFIQAIARYNREGPPRPLYGVIVGDGNDSFRRELEASAVQEACAHQLRIVGHYHEVASAYLAADVVVSASREPEAFGRVMAEAHAMGRCVIATNHGGATEIVVPEVTGWLVPACEPDALCGAFHVFARQSREAREAMEGAARRRVESLFSLGQMQEATLSVYREVLGAHVKP